MVKRAVLISSLLLAAGAFWTWRRYHRWRFTTEARLAADSHIAETTRGPVEYVRLGDATQSNGQPTVLLVHGAPGGHDQGALLVDLVDAGFCVLAPSRPGYLRTPLSTGRSPAEQADALAALLDALSIERMAVLGMSAGGPVALQLALRHPSRVAALVLEAAVSQPYRPAEAAADSWLGRLFLGSNALDFVMWLLLLATRRWPATMLHEYLKIESTYDTAEIERCVAETTRRPAQVDFFRRLIESINPYSLRKPGQDNDLAHLAALPRLPLERVSAPTLVLHSPFDGDVPFAHAEFAASTIPGARLLPVDAAGHFLWLTDDGERVREARLAFLREHITNRGKSTP